MSLHVYNAKVPSIKLIHYSIATILGLYIRLPLVADLSILSQVFKVSVNFIYSDLSIDQSSLRLFLSWNLT